MGARFGLFCYATKEGSEGYADFEGYSEDMLTAEKIELPSTSAEVMIGNSSLLQVVATFRDGHTENVASQTRYEMDSSDAIQIQNGRLYGLAEGTAQVKAIYTDPMGHEMQATFSVRSTFFPFGKEYINTSLFSQGTYTESTRTFKPGQWGQMGWEYPNGADMSGYRYLVVKLKKTQTCDAHLNIFTANSIWSPCCESPAFGSKKQIVVDFQTAKYTSGDTKGQPLDTKNIRIVCFWGNGNGTIVVEDMYLTNNSDYSPETPSAVEAVEYENAQRPTGIFDLQGRRVQGNQLPKGIYIIDGKKVVIK